MATTVVETIGVGKDYATLAAWEAATDIDLVSADEIRVGELHGQLTEFVRIQSATVDATRYRVLRGAEPYSPWDDEGPKINGRITVVENYFRCEHIGIELQTDVGVPVVNISAAAVRFDSVMAIDQVSAGQRVFDGKTYAVLFTNCIALGLEGDPLGGSVGFYSSNALSVVDHCVAVGMGGSSGGGPTVVGRGVHLTHASATCTNNIAIGSQTSDFTVAGSQSACISSDSSGTITSKTLLETFVDSSANDFRPLAGGPADGAGVVGTATDDFQNNAHASSYEIGAYNGTIVETMYASSIASGTTFGQPTTQQDTQPSALASAVSLGTAALVLILGATSIAGGSTLGSSELGQIVEPGTVSSGTSFGAASVVSLLAPRGIASPPALGTPATTQDVVAGGVAAATTFGSPTIIFDQFVTVSGIASTVAVGTPSTAVEYTFEESASLLRVAVDAALSIDVQFDNAGYEPPNNELWARCNINFVTGRLLMVGNGNVYRKEGEVVVRIYAPLHTGDGASLGQVDLVVAAIEDTFVGSVRTHPATVDQAAEANGWWTTTVRVPFDHDERIELTPGSAGTVSDTEDVYSVLRQLVDDVVDVDVQYDNAKYDPAGTEIWARCSILGATRVRQSPDYYRSRGILQLTFHSPLGQGDGDVVAAVDRAVRGLLPATHSGVTLRAPYVTTIGRSGPWWLLSVSSPFIAQV